MHSRQQRTIHNSTRGRIRQNGRGGGTFHPPRRLLDEHTDRRDESHSDSLKDLVPTHKSIDTNFLLHKPKHGQEQTHPGRRTDAHTSVRPGQILVTTHTSAPTSTSRRMCSHTRGPWTGWVAPPCAHLALFGREGPWLRSCMNDTLQTQRLHPRPHPTALHQQAEQRPPPKHTRRCCASAHADIRGI
jgi:hypothetical protein